MKKRIMAALLLAVILCGLWAAPALAATYATVVGGWLRLRLAPSYDATVITSYRTGTTVTVLSESGGWARVMTPDYRLGYMDERYLWFGGDRPQPVPQPTPKARTWTTVNRKAWVTSQNGKGVRLRNAPEVNSYNVMGLYPVGRTVTEMKVSNDGWSYIRIDRKTGYMMSQFLTTGNIPAPVPPPPPPQNPPKPTQNPTNPPATQPPQTPPQGFSGVRLSTQSPRVGEKITLTRQTGQRFQVLWPEKADFPIHPAESFCCREGDKLYFSRWYEDPDYREETVVRRMPDGEILDSFPGSLLELPDGRQWLLE